MTVHPPMVNGTELGAQEWLDAILLRYGLDPSNPPKYCNVCNAKFTIFHALDCKRGGLVTSRHNDLLDRFADLAVKAFTNSHIHDDPRVFASCIVKRPKASPSGTSGSKDQDGAPPEATE